MGGTLVRTPVGGLQVEFFGGGRFIGDLDVGSDFLVAQGCGGFFSRPVSKGDREQIMSFLKVPDPYVSESR